MNHKVVGKSSPRARIMEKVTGQLRFGTDRKVPGMLYARLLRSGHAKARILGVDATAARALEGVVAVFSAGDLPSPIPRFGPCEPDQPLLAEKEVKYQGEAIAVVVAVSDAVASEALDKIRVDYELLTAVCTLEGALRADAPLVHGDLKTNVYKEWLYERGDVAASRASAKHIIENTYTYPMVFHFPLETFTCIAAPEEGGVRIYAPIQHPFLLRQVVSDSLQIPLCKVRVVAEEMGGAFGSKGYPKVEPLTAWLAMHLQKPVKLSFSMDDGFFMARRSSASVKISTGFDADGCIVFQEIAGDYLMGAYLDAAPRVISKAGYTGTGTYRTPNARVAVRGIYSNTVPSTAFRGFGMPQLVLALESQLNAAARHFQLDPLEIRLRNLPKRGEVLIPGDTLVDGNWEEGLNKAAELIGWGQPKKANQGRGLAIGMKSGVHASVSNAIVKLHADGSASVTAGTTEMGQGARTVLAQIAAEQLGIPYESVTTLLGDTGSAPFDTSTAGSRSTVAMGTAVARACDDILNQLQAMAASVYPTEDGAFTIQEGHLVRGNRRVSFVEAMKEYFGAHRGEVIGRGLFRGTRDRRHPLGGTADFWEVIFVGMEIEVDPETGGIKIGKYSCVSDIGKTINPLQAEGQDEGGTLMGIGQSLMERLVYNDAGRLLNGNTTDYLIPTIKDIPEAYAGWFIENHDGPGPHGAKGLGEASAIPVGAAMVGAVYDALGLFFQELPITPEKLRGAIAAEQGKTNER